MNPKDLLEALRGRVEKSVKAEEAFSECDALYTTRLDDEYPLEMGINVKENSYVLRFGHDEPIHVDQKTLFYLYEGLGKLIETSQMDYFNIEGEDLQKKFEKVTDGLPISVSMVPQDKKTGKLPQNKHRTAEEALAALESLEHALSDDIAEAEDSAKEEVEEIVPEEYTGKEETGLSVPQPTEHIDSAEVVKDAVEDVFEDPKEREEMLREQRENMFADLKEFQKVLMGDLKEEAPIEYDEAYFKDIFDKYGPEMLKEELAKIAPEERKPIIANIIREHKQNS